MYIFLGKALKTNMAITNIRGSITNLISSGMFQLLHRCSGGQV